MKTGKINFKSIDTRKLSGMGKIYIPNINLLEKITQDVDVKLSSVQKDFPYRKTTMTVPSIKITARPKGLNFIEKMLGKKTVVDYFPTGNLRELITFDFKGSFADFLRKTVSKIKKI